jgi:hypothetical protein
VVDRTGAGRIEETSSDVPDYLCFDVMDHVWEDKRPSFEPPPLHVFLTAEQRSKKKAKYRAAVKELLACMASRCPASSLSKQ